MNSSDQIAIIGGIIGILGGIAGILGAIISSITAYYAWKAYARDNGKLKAELTTGILAMPPSFPAYDMITVSNTGRRTVSILNVGFVFLKKDGWTVLNDRNISSGEKELDEGKSVVYSIAEGQLKKSDYSHIKVIDETGKEYHFRIAPRWKILFYNLLHMTHIKRKKSAWKK